MKPSLLISIVTLSLAIGQLTYALPTEPEAASDYDQARALIKKKNWTEAATILRRLIEGTRGVPELAIDLSKCIFHLGNREAAAVLLRDYAKHERQAVATELNQRARLLMRVFKQDETYRAFQSGVNFLMAKNFKEATESLDKARRAEPDNLEILLRLAQSWELQGEHAKALDLLKPLKKQNPDEPEILIWLGRALHKSGKIEEGSLELDQARLRLDSSELAINWFSETLIDRGERDQAIALLEADFKNQPYHLMSAINLVKFRLGYPGVQAKILEKAKTDLALASQRADQYLTPQVARFEQELGLDLRDPQGVKNEIQILSQRIEARLQSK